MNFLQQFQGIFKQEYRAVAKITMIKGGGGYIAQTTSGHQTVELKGSGYQVGQTVIYDAYTRLILETAPDLVVVEIRV